MNTILKMTQIDANIKKIIVDGINNSKTKKDIKKEFEKYLDIQVSEMKKADVDKYLINQMEDSAKLNFVKWYKQTLSGLYKMYFSGVANVGIASVLIANGYKIKIKPTTLNTHTILATPNKTSKYLTYSKDHVSQQYIQDYQIKFKDKLNEVLDNLSDSVFVDRNNGSLRNSAEIQTRYNEQKQYFNKLKANNKYAIASQHANCSVRCSYWQGKIFLLDTDLPSRITGKFDVHNPPTPKILGYIDGKPYYSLKQAIDNGFLGYNCRHHLTSYTGQSSKQISTPSQVNKARNVNNDKRYMERQARFYQMRSYQKYGIDSKNSKLDREKALAIKKTYIIFCKKNNVEPEFWRLNVV